MSKAIILRSGSNRRTQTIAATLIIIGGLSCWGNETPGAATGDGTALAAMKDRCMADLAALGAQVQQQANATREGKNLMANEVAAQLMKTLVQAQTASEREQAGDALIRSLGVKTEESHTKELLRATIGDLKRGTDGAKETGDALGELMSEIEELPDIMGTTPWYKRMARMVPGSKFVRRNARKIFEETKSLDQVIEYLDGKITEMDGKGLNLRQALRKSIISWEQLAANLKGEAEIFQMARDATAAYKDQLAASGGDVGQIQEAVRRAEFVIEVLEKKIENHESARANLLNVVDKAQMISTQLSKELTKLNTDVRKDLFNMRINASVLTAIEQVRELQKFSQMIRDTASDINLHSSKSILQAVEENVNWNKDEANKEKAKKSDELNDKARKLVAEQEKKAAEQRQKNIADSRKRSEELEKRLAKTRVQETMDDAMSANVNAAEAAAKAATVGASVKP